MIPGIIISSIVSEQGKLVLHPGFPNKLSGAARDALIVG
jgi:hypothetical protein